MDRRRRCERCGIEYVGADSRRNPELCSNCEAKHGDDTQQIKQLQTEIVDLKADIELRRDYESYLQSEKDPTYSYNCWKEARARRVRT